MPHNRENNNVRRPGQKGLVSVGPAGEVRRLSWPRNQPFCFSPRPLSALAWPLHSCQSTSLSFASAFRLPAITLPPYCLPHLLLSHTCLWRWGWRVSAAISRLSGRSHRLQQWDLPSGAHPPWHRAWGRACCRLSLAKQVVSDLFDFSVCWLSTTIVGYLGGFGGMPLSWHAQRSL